tara:strand:- start:892 stop:1116 length:225 start_codon:yes stop_codon:yes gene_type:complete
MIKKYVILTASEVSSVDFSKVKEDSARTLRYNNDNTKTFVKFTGSMPSFLDGKTQYTNSEMLEILTEEEWQTEE